MIVLSNYLLNVYIYGFMHRVLLFSTLGSKLLTEIAILQRAITVQHAESKRLCVLSHG